VLSGETLYGCHNLTTFGHEAGHIINLGTFTVCGINFFLIASTDGSQDTDLQDIKTFLGKQDTFRVVKLLLECSRRKWDALHYEVCSWLLLHRTTLRKCVVVNSLSAAAIQILCIYSH
jgi:hypothetical protein